jgi:hypothetical protein
VTTTDEFGKVCQTLDALLERDRGRLEAESIRIADWSNRSSREPLSWSYAFESRWTVPPFVVKVRASLDCLEPPTGEAILGVSVHRLAEVFQVGAVPQVQERAEFCVTLVELERQGLGAFVVQQLEAAKTMLPSTYRANE